MCYNNYHYWNTTTEIAIPGVFWLMIDGDIAQETTATATTAAQIVRKSGLDDGDCPIEALKKSMCIAYK